MQIGKIIGRAVATRKADRLENQRILIVQPLDFNEKPAGEPFLAFDCVDSGAAETVIIARGGEAMLPFPEPYPPIDKTAVAIVDNINYYPDA
jgi:ethanolamine utilization protein EutN